MNRYQSGQNEFVCPHSGYYLFSATVLSSNSDNAQFAIVKGQNGEEELVETFSDGNGEHMSFYKYCKLFFFQTFVKGLP